MNPELPSELVLHIANLYKELAHKDEWISPFFCSLHKRTKARDSHLPTTLEMIAQKHSQKLLLLDQLAYKT